MSRPLLIRSGRVTVRLESDLEEMLQRAIEQAAPHLMPALEEHVSRIERDAKLLWPERTGRSKAGLSWEFRIARESISAVIVNTERYAYKIRWSRLTREEVEADIEAAASRGSTPEAQAAIRKGYGRKVYKRHGHGAPNAEVAGKPVWNLSIRDPMKRAAKELAHELAPELKALLAGRS